MGHKNLVSSVIFAALMTALVCGWCLSAGLRAAQGTAVDLEGKAVDPLHTAKGKIIVLIFVRTDCPISNRYAPKIQQLSDTYREKAAFWLVYPDRNESAEMIREHDEEFKYKIHAIRDPQHALVQLSAARITPEAAVFDPTGRLLYHGRIDNLYADFSHARTAPTTHELADALDAAIAGRSLRANSAPAVGCYIADLQ